MKKGFYLLVAAMACVRCDVMDTTDLTIYSADVVWGDPSLAQAFIYDQYALNFHSYLKAPGETVAGVATSTTTGAQPGSFSDFSADNFVGPEHMATIPTDKWSTADDAGWDVFDLIRGANVVIEEASNSTGLSDAYKADFVAQGRFLRGMVYFKHAKTFGAAILIDRPLDTSDDLIMPRNTIRETYDFIIDDFFSAANDLTSTVKTVANAGSAYAFAAEAALQAVGYVGGNYAGSLSELSGMSYNDIALYASEKAIASTTATLSDDYYSIFNDFGAAAESNPEIMLALIRTSAKNTGQRCYGMRIGLGTQYGSYVGDYAAGGTWYGGYPYPMTFTTVSWVGGWVSQDMYDAYEVIDTDGIGKKWNETSYYDDFMANGGWASNVLTQHRDLRFYASIVTDSSAFGDGDLLAYTRIGGNCHRSIGDNSNLLKQGPTPVRKQCHDKTKLSWGAYVDNHWVLMRMGRVYMNYAEALLQDGQTAAGMEYVNKTRVTHGGLNALSTSLSAADAWAAYCAERRIELFYEQNDRFWSLARWAKQGDTDALACLGRNLDLIREIHLDGKGWTECKISELTANGLTSLECVNAEHVWSSRRFLFPIPQTEIDKSGGVITQNDNW